MTTFVTHRWKRTLTLLGVALLAAWSCLCPAAENQVSKVQHVLGMTGVRRNLLGTLSIEGSSLQFAAQQAKFSLPISSITDVYTEQDSVRAIGGVVGTLSSFGPYGSGRFLSLFRKGVDVMSIEYTAEDGGFHGLILRLPKGQGAKVKEWLVAKGAHSSAPGDKP